MSVSKVYTRASLGVEAPSICVETHISNGLPSLTIVGMPETSVKEARERVRSALLNSGFEFPTRRVTINLAPADLPKQGGRYDLAIALGILSASGQLPDVELSHYECLGELALTGELRDIPGVLPATMASWKSGRALLIPEQNAREAALCQTATIYAAKHLLDVCAHLLDRQPLFEQKADGEPSERLLGPDMSEVKGQHLPRRALEVAAAGRLNLLMYGPPGTGKSMLAARLPGIMPKMGAREALEVASVYSVCGELKAEEVFERPFRHPHHSASPVSLIGGGSTPKPGEASLAHLGVLFLDELPEFSRQSLEMLREPLESGEVVISRARSRIKLPARFQLVAAMNPCPCGYQGHPSRRCTDTPQQIENYRRKLSGPLLDRFDMHVEVAHQPSAVMMSAKEEAESSATIRERVGCAQERQFRRQGKLNAYLSPSEISEVCQLSSTLRAELERTMDRLSLSARSVHRVLRLARTLADLASEEGISQNHLLEALAFRALDRPT